MARGYEVGGSLVKQAVVESVKKYHPLVSLLHCKTSACMNAVLFCFCVALALWTRALPACLPCFQPTDSCQACTSRPSVTVNGETSSCGWCPTLRMCVQSSPRQYWKYTEATMEDKSQQALVSPQICSNVQLNPTACSSNATSTVSLDGATPFELCSTDTQRPLDSPVGTFFVLPMLLNLALLAGALLSLRFQDMGVWILGIGFLVSLVLMLGIFWIQDVTPLLIRIAIAYAVSLATWLLFVLPPLACYIHHQLVHQARCKPAATGDAAVEIAQRSKK
eukprot:PLAT3611.4.p1 GENE.PLAT3611.4~~PLAT3611.4.p1  ORF type:complete len:278 (-),score=41.05 PLAT3611.4:364-1197(-)